MDGLLLLLIILLIFQFPIGTIQILLLIFNKFHKVATNDIDNSRRIIIVITTVGGAVRLVNKSINNLREAFNKVKCKHKIVVLTEYFDKGNYNADEIIKVPRDYETPNKSIAKHRAQHYYSQLLPDDKNTYVLHLDDDTTVNEDYLVSILRMKEVGGEGVWRMWKHYNLLSYADYELSTNWDSWGKLANIRHKPIWIGGEGMVIRADIEKKLGWDFGHDLYAEDYLMGQRVARKYSWGYIDANIYRMPPFTIGDYYKQRYRWIDHFLRSFKYALKIAPVQTLLLTITYLLGWVMITGLIIWLYLFFTGIYVPLIIQLLFTIGILYVFIFEQYGVTQSHSLKRRVIMLLLTMPIQLMDASVFYYMLFKRRPKKFVMIKKELNNDIDQ